MSLENKIKGRFENYSPEVTEEVWGNISKNLNKAKAASIFSRGFMAAASVLLLLLAGIGYLLIDTENALVSPSEPRVADLDVEVRDIQNKDKDVVMAERLLEDDTNTVEASCNTTSISDVQKPQPIMSAKLHRPSKGNEPSVSDVNMHAQSRKDMQIIKKLSNIDANLAQSPHDYELEKNSDLALKSHLVSFAQAHGADQSKNKSELSLSVGVGAGALTSGMSDSRRADIIQPKSSYSNSYDGAVSILLKRGRFGFSGGLSYIQHSQNSLVASANSVGNEGGRTLVRAQKNAANEIMLNTVVGRVKAPLSHSSASIMYSPSGDNANVMMSYGEGLNISQNYGYLEIPLEVSYDVLAKRNFAISLVGGGAVGLLANNRARATEVSGSYSLGATEGLSNTSLRANIGVSTSFGLSRRTSLEIQPYYSRYINSINESSIIYTPSMFGVRTILNFGF